MKQVIRKDTLCFLVLGILGAHTISSNAQSTGLLGGNLSWTTTSSWQLCGGGQFQLTVFSNFKWQYGTTVYPVSGSAAYISNSPWLQCPLNGPQGGVGMSVLPAGAPFPVTCGFAWVPTSPSSGAIPAASEVQCGIFSNNTGPNPSTAVVFKNLQALSTSDWTICEGGCPSGGQNDGPPNNNGYLAGHVSSPSMSGAALEMQNVSQSSYPYFDVLFTSNGGNQLDWNLTACAKGNSSPCTFQNFLDDVWFYVPSSSLASIENLEFDPDYTDPNGNTYKMSMECTSPNNSGTPNMWEYWGQNPNHAGQWTWLRTGQSCAYIWQNPNAWLHLQIYTTVNNSTHQYTYQAVGLAPENGQFTYVTWSGMNTPISTPQNQWAPDLFVEQEIDNTYNGGTSTVYYDQYSLIVW